MRLHLNGDESAEFFSELLPKIGNGVYPELDGISNIPAELFTVVTRVKDVIKKHYPDIVLIMDKPLEWLHSFKAFSKGKRACEPPENKVVIATHAHSELQESHHWVETVQLMKMEWGDDGRVNPNTLFHCTKCNSESVCSLQFKAASFMLYVLPRIYFQVRRRTEYGGRPARVIPVVYIFPFGVGPESRASMIAIR
ncbi:hypothetical protein EVAR_38668_1 [Eumeta japonica]|uniref:Uncharacterized protein n=1 Tax=Eumeta variegata TaxID=151549 RepID=A0A4C1YBH1_EUMVA|nr:hypothetical protein EVAR_38668_1 [Eumeta japonica]